MKKFAQTVLTLAACCVIGVMSYAAVVVDEDGVGFVGKGDVQRVYGWNNHDLQDYAHLLQFRFVSASETTWECEEWQNHQNHGIRKLGNVEYEVSLAASNIAYDARKNKKGQITGFNLNGFKGTHTETVGDNLEPGTCPPDTGGNNPKWYVFVEGSLQTGSAEDGVLEVTIDGLEWTAVELPIDEVDE
jgi:hypothetical protein